MKYPIDVNEYIAEHEKHSGQVLKGCDRTNLAIVVDEINKAYAVGYNDGLKNANREGITE